MSLLPILKVDPRAPSEEQELDFELAFQLRLTKAERFALMFQRSRQIAEELLRRGYRRPFEIAKRS